MSTNPYKIRGPASIAFSGGRTSARMLWEILNAHDGKLPDDVLVAFSNTGKERPETLDFVRECQMRFGVQIHWIEYATSKPWFVEVDYRSACRDGAVFRRMVEHRGWMPNPARRTCTSELKIKPRGRFAKSRGLKDWDVVLGLRADEPDRVANQRENEKLGYGCTGVEMPLAVAGITKADILNFWREMPFDLKLRDGDGNCDLCFLLPTSTRIERERQWPGSARWWSDLETRRNMPFRRKTPSYEAIGEAARKLHLPVVASNDGLGECFCDGAA